MMRDKIAQIISDDVDAHLDSGTPWDGTKAADAIIEAMSARIEELEAKADHAWSMVAKGDADVIRAAAHAATLEAKLAKTMGALEEITTCVEDGCYCSEMKMAAAIDEARKALAADSLAVAVIVAQVMEKD